MTTFQDCNIFHSIINPLCIFVVSYKLHKVTDVLLNVAYCIVLHCLTEATCPHQHSSLQLFFIFFISNALLLSAKYNKLHICCTWMCSSLYMEAAAKKSCFFLTDQRLDLNKLGPNDNDTVRGQIVGKKHKCSDTHFFS